MNVKTANLRVASQMARNLTEKGRFYMSSHAPKSNALSVFRWHFEKNKYLENGIVNTFLNIDDNAVENASMSAEKKNEVP